MRHLMGALFLLLIANASAWAADPGCGDGAIQRAIAATEGGGGGGAAEALDPRKVSRAWDSMSMKVSRATRNGGTIPDDLRAAVAEQNRQTLAIRTKGPGEFHNSSLEEMYTANYLGGRDLASIPTAELQSIIAQMQRDFRAIGVPQFGRAEGAQAHLQLEKDLLTKLEKSLENRPDVAAARSQRMQQAAADVRQGNAQVELQYRTAQGGAAAPISADQTASIQRAVAALKDPTKISVDDAKALAQLRKDLEAKKQWRGGNGYQGMSVADQATAAQLDQALAAAQRTVRDSQSNLELIARNQGRTIATARADVGGRPGAVTSSRAEYMNQGQNGLSDFNKIDAALRSANGGASTVALTDSARYLPVIQRGEDFRALAAALEKAGVRSEGLQSANVISTLDAHHAGTGWARDLQAANQMFVQLTQVPDAVRAAAMAGLNDAQRAQFRQLLEVVRAQNASYVPPHVRSLLE